MGFLVSIVWQIRRRGKTLAIVFVVLVCFTMVQVKDQQEAERKKVASQEIQEQLRVQTKHIKEKKEFVLADLSKVEPAVREAKNG